MPRLPPPQVMWRGGGGAVLAFVSPPQTTQIFTFYGFRVFYPPAPIKGVNFFALPRI